MVSLKYPSDADRYVLTYDGRPARRAVIVLFSDEALTVPAEIYADVAGVKGSLIVTSIVETDNRGFLSAFWGPASEQDTLYYQVSAGGPAWPIHADVDARLDNVETLFSTTAHPVVTHRAAVDSSPTYRWQNVAGTDIFSINTNNGRAGVLTSTPNSGLHVAGSMATIVTAITGATTLSESHSEVLATATSAYSVTLPTAVGITGRRYTIVKTDNNANVITIATTSSQTINGSTTYVGLNAQYKRVTVVSDGANWVITNANDQPQPSAHMFPSGYYMVPEGARTTSVTVSAQEWAVPIRFGRSGTLDRIAIDVTGAGTAGTVIRLGIRDTNPDGLPGLLLLDAGTVSGASATQQEITISQYIPKEGLYWLTATPQNTGGTLPTCRMVNGNLTPVASNAIAGALGATSTSGYAIAGVTGALPAFYSSPSRIGVGPLIAVRAA